MRILFQENYLKKMTKYRLLLSVIIIICSSIFVKTSTAACITRQWTIHIVNNLASNNPPLTVHCKSKDDDLGSRILPINFDYNWSFCINPISTRFSCNFQWSNKKANFDLVKEPFQGPCNGPVCSYIVKIDGFYLSDTYPPQGPQQKVFTW